MPASEIVLPDIPPGAIVACDTETSGLYVDDGARVAVVQVAWYEGGGLPVLHQFKHPQKDGSHLHPPYAPDVPLHSAMFPFDQGLVTPLGPKTDIPVSMQRSKKRRIQESLFPEDEAPNLPPHDYLALMEWLTQFRLVFHNAKFDVEMLQSGLRGKEDKRSRLPRLVDNIYWDTQVMCLVLWPWAKSSLKPTMMRLCGEQEGEAQRALEKWVKAHDMRYDLAPWSLLGPYADYDPRLTIRLAVLQDLAMREGELAPPWELEEIFKREVALARTLTRMESRGVGWDIDLAYEQANRLAKEADFHAEYILQIIADKCPEIAPRTTGGITEDVMRRFWFSEEGLHLLPPKVHDTGQASVDKEVVERLVKDGVPAAEHWQALSKAEHANSMWYRGWSALAGPPDPHWHGQLHPRHKRPARLRTSFNQGRSIMDGKGGTISGRLAVARWQAQATPHNYQLPKLDPPLVTVRECFRTDPRHVAVEIDLSQCEFRVAAAVSGCRTMITAFEEGLDIHDETCRRMFRIQDDAPDWFFKRQVSKRCGLGMIYGAGVFTIGRQIEKFTGEWVSDEEITEWVGEYKRTYPELVRKSKWAQRQAERNGVIRLAGGRVRWFGPGEEVHKAFNQLVQGSVAEIMKVAMNRVEEEVPGTQLLQVHDSVVCEYPQLNADMMCSQTRHVIQDTFEQEFGVKFKTDAKLWATPDGCPEGWEWVVKPPF